MLCGMIGPTPLETVDGRVARGGRTRAALVEALLSLLNERKLRPTARELAERAGISLRTVFQHFGDLETLFATVADEQMARVAELTGMLTGDGARELRLRQFIQHRTQVLEAITPVRRAALLQEPFSPEIAKRLKVGYGLARREVATVFAQEMGTRSGVDAQDMLEALDAASSWSNWDALRRQNGLSEEDARRVLERTMRALLDTNSAQTQGAQHGTEH